jgi:hypothetical protein
MTSEAQPDFDPEYFADNSVPRIQPDSEPLMNLKVAMLFPSDGIENQQESQYKTLFEIQQRYPHFVGTRNGKKYGRASMGSKRAPCISDAEEVASLEIKKRRESELFGVPSLVATLDDLPRSPYIKEISNRTTDGVLAGSMLLYVHTLSSSTYKTESGRTATGSENIAAFICEKNNLGRSRKMPGRPRLDEIEDYPTVDEGLAKKSWKRFKTVCHLWAAYVHVVGFKRDLSALRLTDKVDWKSVLILAKQYEAFASDFFHHIPLIPVVNLGFRDLDFSSRKLSISEIPEGVVESVNTWVGQYNTKHK